MKPVMAFLCVVALILSACGNDDDDNDFLNGSGKNEEIYVMNADGANQINLTDNPAEDSRSSWSPDGSKILFDSDRNGDLEVYVMNADGSNQINLTNNPALDSSPSWSPDGTKIAFHSVSLR